MNCAVSEKSKQKVVLHRVPPTSLRFCAFITVVCFENRIPLFSPFCTRWLLACQAWGSASSLLAAPEYTRADFPDFFLL